MKRNINSRSETPNNTRRLFNRVHIKKHFREITLDIPNYIDIEMIERITNYQILKVD